MPSVARAPSLLWPFWVMATLLWASHWDVAPMLPDLEWVAPDKLAHFAVFGLLATLWLRRLAYSLPGPWAAVSAWILTAGFGLLDEFIQSLNPVRYFDPADLVADASGAFVAVAAYLLIPVYRNLLEASVWPRRPTLPSAKSLP